MKNSITIDTSSKIPKFQQIVHAIITAVDRGLFHQGDQIPSMNDLQNILTVSRETVFKAYKELRHRGVISSHPGKGYYVSMAKSSIERNIFLLFDDFTLYKEVIYRSFLHQMGDKTMVDMYFHHYNKHIFQSLIREATHKYTDFVLVPLDDQENMAYVNKILENQNVYILDLGIKLFGKNYPSVCQDFENDVFNSLYFEKNNLLKYNKIIFAWGRTDNIYRNQIRQQVMKGLKQLSQKTNLPLRVVPYIQKKTVEQSACYILPSDFDLVAIVEEAQKRNLEIGSDIGVISFNETPLKRIIANGITTLSTDFELMGKNIANLITSRKKMRIANPAKLIKRNSF